MKLLSAAVVAIVAGLMIVSGAVGYRLGRARASASDLSALKSKPATSGSRVPQAAALLDAEARSRASAPDGAATAAAGSNLRTALSATTEPASDSSFTPSIDQLRFLAAAQKEKLAMINVPITVNEREAKLSDSFVRLFGVSDAERQTLDAALARARHDMDELATTNVAVKQDSDSLAIVMKPFEGGADVYDRLMDAFAQTLGPDRNAAFVALQSEQLARTFDGFGAEERTITFTREGVSGGSGSIFSVRDDRHSPQSRSVGTWTMSNPDALAQRYPAIAPYLDKLSQLPIKTKQGSGR